ncbi:MAG: hypothetical protein ACHQNE_02190 [Candidatus Kapaibacterium sp.]
MKHNLLIGKMISASVIFVAFAGLTSLSRAQAVSYYLTVDGISGEGQGFHKTVSTSPDKSLTGMTAGGGSHGYGAALGPLKPGTYTVRALDKSHRLLKGQKGTIEVDSYQMGTSNADMAIKGQGGPSNSTAVPPTKQQQAEAAAAAASTPPAHHGPITGKRRHTPLVIRKEWDASTPLTFTVPVYSGDENPTESVSFSFEK